MERGRAEVGVDEEEGERPRVLVTAGPTHEPIDEVRYVGNRSSGRVGASIADAAAARGMRVEALLGPNAMPPSGTGVGVARFCTSGELSGLLRERARAVDALIMAAAVADYRPVHRESGKVRRGERGARWSLELEPVPDLLAGVSAELGEAGGGGARPLLVGFALEPAEGLIEAARAKLERKGVDAIVGNPLETMEAGGIEATLVWAGGGAETTAGRMSKAAFGVWLMDRLAAPIADAAARRRGAAGL